MWTNSNSSLSKHLVEFVYFGVAGIIGFHNGHEGLRQLQDFGADAYVHFVIFGEVDAVGFIQGGDNVREQVFFVTAPPMQPSPKPATVPCFFSSSKLPE